MNEPVSETTQRLINQLYPNGRGTKSSAITAEYAEQDRKWKERRTKQLLKKYKHPTRYDYAAVDQQVEKEFREFRDAEYVRKQEERQRVRDAEILDQQIESASAVRLMRFSEELRKRGEIESSDRHHWQYLARQVHTSTRVRVPSIDEVLDADTNPLEDLF